jgi:hypothetical protein
VPRTIQLDRIISSQTTKPVTVVVDKITMIEDHRWGGGREFGSAITLEGGDTIRVIQSRQEVARMMA